MRAGDTIFLQGEVGMGKSVFARSFIREATKTETLEVVSPTFLLHETYDVLDTESKPGLRIQHFDLYRFDPDKQLEVMLQRAEFEECLSRDVVLIEWAEYLPPRYSGVERLVVHIEEGAEEGSEEADVEGSCPRKITLAAHGGPWVAVVEAIAGLLEESGSDALRLLAAS